ncbi:hypothetical protein P3T27_003375 [Kitasatospora sp. MAA19]|uniref:PP2C family protein-serine/threonine phosphatase n=1 Tax=Kitasatospora sp. MAA19 TaxID=3035090 RepID=UPI0024757BDD|nr:PP2C family protein-serine/threonine phosphatase [Kitasatospora sp. MAA19]MDH6706648.1 hypothetical protein [Kitasatospora sp. MAA19]
MSTPVSSPRGLVLTVSALVVCAGTDLLSRSSLSATTPIIASVVASSALWAVPWAGIALRMASIAAQPAIEPRRDFTAGHACLITSIAVSSMAIAAFLSYVARLRMTRDRALERRGVLEPPGRMGDLAIAVRYASAAGAGRDRGVLYEVMETPFGARVVMGDVHAGGRPTVMQVTARVLGEIREASQYEPSLDGMAARAEACVSRSVAAGVFMTAVFAEFSGAAEVVLLSCGHALVPLVASDDGVRTAAYGARPPVGLAELAADAPLLRQELFAAGQTLVLCSDGVAEARGPGGACYPLEERLARLAVTAGWRMGGVQERAELLRSDLLAFAGDGLGDDAVFLLVERVPSARSAPVVLT